MDISKKIFIQLLLRL